MPVQALAGHSENARVMLMIVVDLVRWTWCVGKSSLSTSITAISCFSGLLLFDLNIDTIHCVHRNVAMQNPMPDTGERRGVQHRPELPVLGGHRPGLDIIEYR
jgi:hypothetical protein